MTISLKLDDSDRERIERQLASGRLRDASAVVSAGPELLEELDTARDHWLEAEIPARFADAEMNPEKLISGEDVFAHLEMRHCSRESGR
ncbi:MAG: type II toxin-antitoxin system ParD family antitoxin [Rhizobium sp.]|nr:type II toxin-antitoxin system ParD family antitoxin [Rhizobium sp.]